MNLFFASIRVVWASWRCAADELVHTIRHTNEVIEVFEACGGRRHLYSRLYKFGERARYCDTDRIIFVQKDGELPQI